MPTSVAVILIVFNARINVSETMVRMKRMTMHSGHHTVVFGGGQSHSSTCTICLYFAYMLFVKKEKSRCVECFLFVIFNAVIMEDSNDLCDVTYRMEYRCFLCNRFNGRLVYGT